VSAILSGGMAPWRSINPLKSEFFYLEQYFRKIRTQGTLSSFNISRGLGRILSRTANAPALSLAACLRPLRPHSIFPANT
jgi:hypothetical protein